MEKVFASVRLPLQLSVTVARTSQSPFPLVAMAERPPEPTLRHLTRQQSDTEKNKKYPTHRKGNFLPTHLAHLVFPDTQTNASKNQKSQADQSPPTTPNYF